MKEVDLESNRFLCGECPTRWNSKHDLLKIACSLREVFFKYELVDDCYYRDLERVPKHSDFDSGSIEMDTELTRYLNEPRIKFTSDFDILEWWKLNAPRFPIVARMAKVEAVAIVPRLGKKVQKKAIIDDIDGLLNDDDVAKVVLVIEEEIAKQIAKGNKEWSRTD
ncbi:zinc finger BED domain-containing protein RICESLEEPER 2 [Tanacetum coccineum]